MTQEDINKIIEDHKHWLSRDCEGWENMRADLSDADLSDADLTRADLTHADLSDAYLRYVDLRCANLRCADLTHADLSDANLSGADLTHADLSDANLSGADLRCANLSGANLRCADLSDANLRCVDLRCANLSDAGLSGADLSGAKSNEGTAFYDLQCPEEGDFIAFKKASGKIVRLRIPAEARRSSAATRKCRAEFADVLEILNIDRSRADVSEVRSNYNCNVIYRVGERITADSWDDDRWNEYSHGIYFFITFDEAVRF